MTWVRIDDQLTEHPKCAALTPQAWTLWLHGLLYCSRNLTDGAIPEAILNRLAPIRRARKVADELVEAGLWRYELGTFYVHDYTSHQRSRDQIVQQRASVRMRQQRHRTGSDPNTGAESAESVTPMSRRDMSVSHADVTPPETETESDSGYTLQRDSVGVDPHLAGKARAIVAQVRTQATQTASRSDVDVIVGQAAAKIGQILEDYPDAPDQVVVGYLLGQGNNLRHYRR